MSRKYNVKDGEINYLCNAMGEFNHGLTEERLYEISPDLITAYDNLLSQGAGFDMYLVQYNGQPGVAVVDCFPEDFVNVYGGTTEVIDEMAYNLAINPQLAKAQVLTGANDIPDGYAMTVIFPCDTTTKAFYGALDLIQSAENQMINGLSLAEDEPKYGQGLAR